MKNGLKIFEFRHLYINRYKENDSWYINTKLNIEDFDRLHKKYEPAYNKILNNFSVVIHIIVAGLSAAICHFLKIDYDIDSIL